MRRNLLCNVIVLSVMAVSLLFLSLHTLSGTASADGVEKSSCVTGECHGKMGSDKFVHAPVALGDCDSCHRATGKHAFPPIRDAGKLCSDCHERLDSHKYVHAPVKQGKCTACHDPHQSANKYQLRAAGAELCFKCHARSIMTSKYVHGPVAVGSCTTCHDVHQADFPKLLRSSANTICFDCHADKAEAFKSKKFVHAPVQKSCIQCHNPHGGAYQYNLKGAGTEDLCMTCHKEKQAEINTASVKHKGLTTERRCLACHDPHAADYPKQLLRQPADLCMSCHDREYQSGTRRVANMKEVLENNKELHGPLKQKDCSGCHNSHGSNNFRILRETFPPVFYAAYNQDNYKLCFMCHEKNLAENERTTTMTAFRNGDQNLHFVHVNKAVKGRTCRACHDAHATNNPRHIRDSVPFNAWKLPISFSKTVDGGSCLPGCHKQFSYDRKIAVKNQ